MRLFLPKQVAFFELFKKVNADLKKIVLLFNQLSKDFSDFEEYSIQAKEIEHAADKTTHDIIDKLNKTFITPFDREDIYLLAHEFDDIIDLIELVIRDIKLFKIPRKIDEIEKFADLFIRTMSEFEKLLECLEGQKYTDYLIEIKIKIHNFEDEGDVLFNEGIQKLFAEETDAVLILKYKEILEGMENVMDKFQKVTDIIEGIIVKSSS